MDFHGEVAEVDMNAGERRHEPSSLTETLYEADQEVHHTSPIFLLFHAIILSILDALYAFLCHFISFL